jgi:Ser/Thr protein kinase RdoA (MazF antagonist)
MQPSVEALTALLEEHYASGPITLRSIGELNPVHHVERELGPHWVVRVGRNVPRYATTLLYLEEVGYPAPRLVPAAEGSPLASLAGQPVMVMRHIDGTRPPLVPHAMEQVGEALARLHALPAVSHLPPPPLPSAVPLPAIHHAGMQPRGEIAFARSRLDLVRDTVPAPHLAHYEILDRACAAIDLLEDLPPVFIHADAHYNNTILTPQGDLIYLDYDSAGPGPAIVDLGFLLVNAHAGPIVAPPKPPDPARVAATIRGYCRHRLPSTLESVRLIHAVRFRPLVWACATFAREVERGDTPSEWPLHRLQMSDDLSAQARDLIPA